jgi:F-type H+-transporting ATPase subunit delta
MAAQGVAKRYAEAVFDLARDEQNHDAWIADLEVLANAASDEDGGAFFSNPGIPTERKTGVLNELLTGPEHQEVRNLARLLMQRQRFDILPGILEVYRDMVLESRGIAIANVVTAVELTDAERAEVSRGLGQIVGKEIELRTRVDPSIIGGIVARVGDQLIDASVTTKLRQLRSTLVT